MIAEVTPDTYEVIGRLERLRRQLRLAAVSAGFWQLLALLAVLFWCSFLVDYLFEPAVSMRVVLAVIGIGIAGWLVFRLAWSRMTAALPLRSVALAVERRFPELSDGLVTAVELSGSAHPFSKQMLQIASHRTAELMRQLPISTVVHWKPAVVSAALAVLLCSTAAGLYAASPELTAHWLRRSVFFEDVLYPRATRLVVVGFEEPVKKVALGRDFELLVDADPSGVVPDRVAVRYRLTDSNTKGFAYMVKVGQASFRHQWQNVLEPVEFVVEGGDARTQTMKLQTVQPPRVTGISAVASYPKHTGRAERKLLVQGVPLNVPVGTKLDFTVETNKPLRWLEVQAKKTNDSATNSDSFRLSGTAGESHQQFSLVADETVHLELQLEDTDGIHLETAFPVDVIAVADQPPSVEATLAGVRQEITANAFVPIEFNVRDDYGISSLAFSVQRNEQEPQWIPIELSAKADGTQRAVFPVEPLRLQVKDVFDLQIVARDNDTLHGPNKGQSANFRFTIVSPEQLLSNIATVELNLRQRFDQVVRELEESQRELGRLPSLIQEDESLSLPRLSSERLIQNLRKSGTETAAITAGFHAVIEELQNNQVGTPAMYDRLQKGVIAPLEDIEGAFFPECVQQFIVVRQAIEAQDDDHQAAIASADQSLARLINRCRQALQAMRKLETFNEAISMLRTVLEAQKELLDETKAKRKEAILDLLK